jgi:hypothetical protein
VSSNVPGGEWQLSVAQSSLVQRLSEQNIGGDALDGCDSELVGYEWYGSGRCGGNARGMGIISLGFANSWVLRCCSVDAVDIFCLSFEQ